MYVCQWHLDTPFGKQREALTIMKAWGADKFSHSEFRRAQGGRMLVGHVGASPSHLVDEYLFDSLADFEVALAGMGSGDFKRHADALAPLIVPASQHWKVWRVVE
jgi:hypothetical protein